MKRFLLALTLASTGCGSDAFIILEITGDCAGARCEIPAAVDSAVVRTFDAADLSEPILSQYIALDGQTFPITVLLEPGGATPARLTEQVLLGLGDMAVGEAAVEHGWEDGRTNRVGIIVEVP
ncbi:MAG: hypothetical protein AAF658_01695 [Myxococcota bacterium]